MRLETAMFWTWMKVSRLVQRLPSWLRVPLFILLGLSLVLLGLVLSIPWAVAGFIRGLWYRWFPPPAVRDVSRIGEDLDVLTETVEDEGQPLKEHQRRVIYRDPRLLPKAQPPADVWPKPRRKRVMTASDANRLFAGTMRTRDRRIRDLLADEEQLQRWGLPVWRTEADLAQALEVDVGTLRHFSIHREAERVRHYVTFAIPKRNGDPRLIMAPKRRLKALQRKLLRLLVDELPVSEPAHGFRRGRSIRSGAGPHVGKAVVLKMDLRDFFPSVTFGRVRGYLIAAGYSYPVATTLAVLMTEAERQPVEIDGEILHIPVGRRYCVQGAPTSPGVCNAICHRLDRRLSGLAHKYGWDYTRYADDLTFSGQTGEPLQTIRRLARQVCTDEGFEINSAKTRVLRKGRRQTVTGVVVNDAAGLSRKERRRLRAAIHRLQQPGGNSPPTLTPAQLRGKLAYLKMLNPQQAARLAGRLPEEPPEG